MASRLAWCGYRACLLAQPFVRVARPLKGAERLPLPPPGELARLLVGRRPPPRPTEVRHAVCTQYFNEAPFLEQWIDFHRLMGVERFYLYDNESTDDHEEVLAPYEQEGIVVRHHWPGSGRQREAFGDCVARHGRETRWMSFVDVDEFLFSTDGRPVADVLEPLSAYPGVGVAWISYGHDGREEPVDAPLIWAYQRRAGDEHPSNTRIKSTIDSVRAVEGPPGDAHHFHYRAGFAVDVEGQMVYGAQLAGRPPRLDKLRINHYWSKSRSEILARQKRKSAAFGDARRDTGHDLDEVLGTLMEVHDDAAIRAVKAAVAQRPGIADYLAEEPAALARA